MKNEEILALAHQNDKLKENDGRKWSVIIQNPPYGSTGNDVIHLKFIEKCLELSNKQIVVMPFSFITKTAKVFNKYKELFSKYLLSVEEVDSKKFTGTAMPNVGIYTFNIHKKENEKINIQRLNQNNNQEINSLLDISEFNNYEKEIIKYLESQGKQEGTWAGGHSHCTKYSLEKQGITNPSKIQELINQNILDNSKHLKNNKVYMMINAANGGMNGTAISTKMGNIFDNLNDLKNEFIKRNQSTGYNVLIFNSIKEAENCKIALKNPLLRFTIYRMQNDQNMGFNRAYKYIPAINWEDDRVKTDEGLLEVCGCPKDKCKEYAEYCKKVINEVDKK